MTRTFRYFLYLLPNGADTMAGVMDIMLAADDETFFDWEPMAGAVVKVSTLSTAVYLRTCFPHRPANIDGDPILRPDEIWVPEQDRAEAERMIRDECSSPHEWFDVSKLGFDTEDEHRRFGAAYTQLTGLENACSPEPQAP